MLSGTSETYLSHNWFTVKKLTMSKLFTKLIRYSDKVYRCKNRRVLCEGNKLFLGATRTNLSEVKRFQPNIWVKAS